MTFNKIMTRCLARVSGLVDKREGAVIYDALAPAVAELAQIYIALSTFMDRAFADTATDVDLTKKAQERSVFRKPSSKAIRLGYFEDANGAGYEIPIGARFSGGDANYTVIERVEAGIFKLESEEAGAIGNVYFGTLFPIDFLDGLATATLADILTPGEDEESDDSLRKRYVESLKTQAFGGNIADYKNKVGQLQGVGAVKVIPIWNGGGTVKLIIINSEWTVPSSELIEDIQTAIDPVVNQGEGLGIAPIGHVVTVVPVDGVQIDANFRLTYEDDASWDVVQEAVEAAINAYLQGLAKTWTDTEHIVVRVAQVENSVLGVTGIIDIQDTTINGSAANIILEPSEIPLLGVITDGAA